MKNAATGVPARISPKSDPNEIGWPGWIPLIVLPTAAIAARPYLVPWCFMWTLAAAIFFGCKWQSWWEHRSIAGATIGRSAGFLFVWPGMDAKGFLDPEKCAQRPEGKEWLWAIVKTAFGAVLLGVLRGACLRQENFSPDGWACWELFWSYTSERSTSCLFYCGPPEWMLPRSCRRLFPPRL